MKKIFTLFFALVASVGTMFAGSFEGFEADNSNKLSEQIYSGGLIQNQVNVTLVETDASVHKYNINLVNAGEGTFTMGGITFAFSSTEAGKTAYKTYNVYIQPNGVDRIITIPTTNGEQVKVTLVEDCAGILVNGESADLVAGDNILTATGSSIVLQNSSAKPKISAILSMGGGGDGNVDPDPGNYTEEVTIDGFSYLLDTTKHIAQIQWGPSYRTIVSIPSSITYKNATFIVTSIGENAFLYCEDLTSVTIPNSITGIGGGAFSGLKGLTSIEIPNSVTYIGEVAFSGCSGLTSIEIPNSVTSIGYQTFRNCTGLTSIEIPNSVTNIGEGAFYGCTGLTSITIPNSVTSIGEKAFYGCKRLTSVTIGNSLKNIGYAAFGNSDIVNEIHFNGSLEEWCTKKMWNPSNISDCYDLYIQETKITDAIIPSTVTNIKEWAFRGCNSLISVTIPNSVTSIGEYAFCACRSLTSVSIPNSVISIGKEAFASCISLPVENNLVYAGTYLVGPTEELSTYTIKDGTKWIGYEAFARSSSLTSITIPNSVTSIEKGAFSGCYSLTSVTIPNSVTNIRDSAFAWCTSLTSITIPNSITSIGDYTFASCSVLTSIEIPNSVTSLGASAFSGCKGLTSLTIGNGVTQIEKKAFFGCDYLTSVTIPNSVTNIKDSAFYGCYTINSVIIGTSVKSIGDGAFSQCGDLKSVTCKAVVPPSCSGSPFSWATDFMISQYQIPLLVPSSSVEAYKAAKVWKNFKIILPLEAEKKDVTTTTITTTETTAEITWPQVANACIYELVVKSADGKTICTLIFDSEGHLTSVAFNAPSRVNAPQQTQTDGFSFTITDLEKGATYTYTLTVKDSNGKVLKTENGKFTTGAQQGVDEIESGAKAQKVIRDGQIYILRGSHTYDAQGKLMK